MKCEDALPLISGHVDRCNSIEEEAQLREHLDGCEACRNLLAAFQELETGILTLQEEAPASLCDDVMAAIRQEASGKTRKRRHWANIAVAAVLVLVVGVGAYVSPVFGGADAAPEMAVMKRAVVETAADDALVATSVQTADQEDFVSSMKRSSGVFLPQALADERGVPVAVVSELYPLMETCEVELLEDGTLLYLLPEIASAKQLCETYEGILYEPAVSSGDLTCSYAVIVTE